MAIVPNGSRVRFFKFYENVTFDFFLCVDFLHGVAAA